MAPRPAADAADAPTPQPQPGSPGPPRVFVFTAPGCIHCQRAKAALAQAGIHFGDADASGAALRRALADATGRRTVPQVGRGSAAGCRKHGTDKGKARAGRHAAAEPWDHHTLPAPPSPTPHWPAQVYAVGEHIGGADDLEAALADGSLARLLQQEADGGGGGGGALPPGLRAAVERAAAEAAAEVGAPAPPGGPPLPPDLADLAAAAADPKCGIVAAAAAAKGGGAAKAQAGASGGGTFSGAQLLAWLAQRPDALGGRAPGAAGAALLAANAVTLVSRAPPPPAVVTAVDPAKAYRLRAAAPRAVAWGQPLNAAWCECAAGALMHAPPRPAVCALCQTSPTAPTAPRPAPPAGWGPAPARTAEAVAADLRARAASLYDRHLSAGGARLDYAGLQGDPEFWAYADAAAELQRVRRRAGGRGCAVAARRRGAQRPQGAAKASG
jgi:glutaredoxin